MCGIVGYIGKRDSRDILIRGLKKLEYRGYDSAGIAVASDTGLHLYKEKGRIAILEQAVDPHLQGTLGIGHTRWATHGEPNRQNAHPHQSHSGRFTLVHNGVIENYVELKKSYLSNCTFESETDTEVIVQLIDQFAEGQVDPEPAFIEALKCLKGSYAIALLDSQNPDILYVAKNKSPLLLGMGDQFHVVSSDAMAMIEMTDCFMEIMDEEIALITRDEIVIKDFSRIPVERTSFKAELDLSDIEKGTYPHYMLKEIEEQPAVIRKIISQYQENQNGIHIEKAIIEIFLNADRIHILACGTSYHAGLIGMKYLEKIAQIPAQVHIASEFAYDLPLLSKKTVFILISQSGETADCRQALIEIKKRGFQALTLTNVLGSTLSREAHHTLHLVAGPEIAVASTKAYTAQISVLLLLSSAIAAAKGIKLPFDPLRELGITANKMEWVCDQKADFESIAKEFLSETRNAFFIGRSMDYGVCLEAALKLKEISYIQTEAYASGELKHGPIALIEKGTPVIALATQEHLHLNLRSNLKETLARGANPCLISMKGFEQDEDRFVLPSVHPYLTPLLSIIPMQLIAYYAALHRGNDIDKPRNLAKSVTVE